MIRRRFMGGGAAALGALGLPLTYLGLQRNRALPEPAGQLYCVDEVSFGVLAVLASRIVPLEGADPKALAHGVDQSLRYSAPEAQAEFSFVLKVLENGLSGILTRGRFTLFSELEAKAKDEAIRRWTESPIDQLRGAMDAIRKLCLGVYYGPPSRLLSVGYPGSLKGLMRTPPPITARGPLSKPWSST